MIDEKLGRLKAIAKHDHLSIRIMLTENDDAWTVKLTSLYHGCPLCMGSDEDLEAAIDAVLEKAERLIAPHRTRMRNARLDSDAGARRAERRLLASRI